jgi:GDP-4-dehydro-6-deoxy-D-mannose reductase
MVPKMGGPEDRADANSLKTESISGLRAKRLLVTGHTGFVGANLCRTQPCLGLTHHGDWVDLANKDAVSSAVADARPEAVIHLAARTFVPEAIADPLGTFEVNFLGTYHLLSALSEFGFKGRFLYISTADAYGRVSPELLPVREDFPLRPRNPYSVSKVAAEALCYQWSQTGPFEIIIARPFNHIGPGQDDRFVVSGMARQVAAIAAGQAEAVVTVGDIDVTRDFTDVGDVIRAYLLLLEQGRNGEIYNICSGRERSIRSILDELLQLAGVSAEIRVDRERLRPSEQRRMIGSYEKLRRQTGWEPQIPFQKTLGSILQYYRGV